jgi:hypothetical protein
MKHSSSSFVVAWLMRDFELAVNWIQWEILEMVDVGKIVRRWVMCRPERREMKNLDLFVTCTVMSLSVATACCRCHYSVLLEES